MTKENFFYLTSYYMLIFVIETFALFAKEKIDSELE